MDKDTREGAMADRDVEGAWVRLDEIVLDLALVPKRDGSVLIWTGHPSDMTRKWLQYEPEIIELRRRRRA
jgi:hypothetical protein